MVKKRVLEDLFEKYPKFHWSQVYYDKTGDTVLHCVSRLGFADIIEYLLSNFTPKAVDCRNKDDKTALHEAAQFSQYEACKKLIKHGADINAIKRADWTPLMLACTKINGENSFKTVELLLRNGAIVNYKNKDGWTALHLISREGDATILNLLISYGLDIKVKTKNGRTALHIAALHGNISIVKVLLNLDLNVNEKDSCGNVPIHEAVLGNNIDVCKLLIESNANIFIRNNSDYSLIHLAASEGHIGIIEFILNELKCEVNETNKNGLNALHCAARKGQKDAYQFLVKNGGNINVKDNFGRLPFDYF
ncbi:hypothetical protein NQ314_007096 [Rhamnusium bicolor]|uniref:Uncharacterized protein n=1 Tax=Rhamnusium bicolor TaxID=1586634 RepID=A0AAV8YSK8_9CUCU|nr:hypothetical protein NQ314_007096 [Rhamnusium bicolor]